MVSQGWETPVARDARAERTGTALLKNAIAIHDSTQRNQQKQRIEIDEKHSESAAKTRLIITSTATSTATRHFESMPADHVCFVS
jgi:hypothetical protein